MTRIIDSYLGFLPLYAATSCPHIIAVYGRVRFTPCIQFSSSLSQIYQCPVARHLIPAPVEFAVYRAQTPVDLSRSMYAGSSRRWSCFTSQASTAASACIRLSTAGPWYGDVSRPCVAWPCRRTSFGRCPLLCLSADGCGDAFAIALVAPVSLGFVEDVRVHPADYRR